ncbi:MAG: hypothetical protein NC231_02725 [Bacillus sp. (in: Bacteria)]|nr:hypothetical protein [Bacillus sp. (in: firmicutes)]MCM1425329.1 hypothetical protein [Eubacterium sp.]
MTAKQKDKILLGMFFLGTFLVRIFYITKVKGPFVYTDELGYWGHAAAMTGHTWAGVMQNMPWYAFGYSLLLAPLFLITTNMLVMYRMAVIINIVLSLISFWLAFKVIQKAAPEISGVLPIGAIAFTATSYSTYIFNSYIGWSETLLVFLLWLLLYELILFEEKPGVGKGILIGVTAGYAYMVHNRVLAVIAALILTMLLLLWRKKIKIQHFLSVVIAIALLFGLSFIGKQYFNDLLVNNTVLQNAEVNIISGEATTFSGQSEKLREVLTLDGIKRFLLNVIGQIWQLLSATYLLVGLGIVFCIHKGIKALKEKQNISLYIFPFMALAGTIAMTSLYFIKYVVAGSSDSVVRIDTLFYGRYSDALVGFFIMMALLFLYEKREKKSYAAYIIPICAIYLTASFIIYYNLKDIENFYLNTVSTVGIYIFHWLGEFSVVKCVLMALCVSALYLIFFLVKMPKQFNRYIGCLLLIFFFSTTALACMRIVIRGENDYIQQYAQIFDFLNENTKKEDIIYTTAEDKPAYDLQTRVVDKAVISIDKSQMNAITGSPYIVMPEQDYADYADEGYTMCLQVKDYVIIQRKAQ